MGTKERRQRDFESREQLFLETARELIHAEGLLNLQMARLAEKCEYAVGTLYQHFASKEDLLLAIACQDVLQHGELFERLKTWKAGSRERMFGVAVADMIFVATHPEHFRIAQYAFCDVVWGAASRERREAVLEANRPISAIVRGIIEDAVAAGDLQLAGQSADQVMAGIWALSIGMHNLVHAEGVIEKFAVAEPYRLLCRHLQALLNGLGWKPLADPADDAALEALIKKISNEVFHDCCKM